MDWTNLPTDYKNAEWDGKKKYRIATIDDVSTIDDITEYRNLGDSFFGAEQANAMNRGMNQIAAEFNAKEGIAVYTYTKSGTVHNFTGSGANGRVKMATGTTVAAGDTVQVNGKTVSAYYGTENFASALAGESVAGKWLSFVFDGSQINFKGGGGVGVSALAGTTAEAADVLSGKTFYSKDKTKKTGTMPSRYYNTAASSVWTDSANSSIAAVFPYGYYPVGNTERPDKSQIRIAYEMLANTIRLTPDILLGGNNILGVEGGIVNHPKYEETLGVVLYDNKIWFGLPRGAYLKDTSSGWPEVWASKGDVANAISLKVNQIVEGANVLGIQGTGLREGSAVFMGGSVKIDSTRYVINRVYRSGQILAASAAYAVTLPKGTYLAVGSQANVDTWVAKVSAPGTALVTMKKDRTGYGGTFTLTAQTDVCICVGTANRNDWSPVTITRVSTT